MIDHEVWQRDFPEQKEKNGQKYGPRDCFNKLNICQIQLYSQNRELAKFINEHNVISICASPGPISEN
jgi:hypothetical protein